jgi:TonB family protein
MLFEALAAAAVGAATPEGAAAPTPSVTVVAPARKAAPAAATVTVPVDEDAAIGLWTSVWPMEALNARRSGHVVLSCYVDHYGLAEWCKVASETPQNQGFGAAAMELRPTFKLTPAAGPDGPIDAVMNIAIEFRPPNPQFIVSGDSEGQGEVAGCGGLGKPCPEWRAIGNPLPRRPVTMLNAPVWVRTATFDDWMRAYPAQGGGVEGYAVAHCAVEGTGALAGCQLIREVPEKRGFGAAALRLAARFRVSPEWAVAPDHRELWVDVPIRFEPPGSHEPRMVTSPYWLTGFDPDQTLRLFPPEAAAKGLTTGVGTARCVVAEDGSLDNCAPATADPDGLGFGEAAARLASTMKLNPWTADGAPVDGAMVQFGVRLNLKSE